MDVGGLVAKRFRLLDLVGAGGAGRVYRAVDQRTEQPVALKILPGEREVVAERLSREVQILTRLDHPGIVRYVDHGPLDDDDYFLAMEWIEGEDLAQRMRRAPLTLAETVDLVTGVADALSHAHARQVIHRDIKPANILLPRGLGPSAAKLVDFGIAKPIQRRRSRGTHPGGAAASITGVPVGTIGYMAPEQARGERRVDARADVFALGCVLYECLADAPAFTGEHALAVLAKILLEAPQPIGGVARAPVPAWLEQLVHAMLALDPAARPADAGAVSRTLLEHANERDALAVAAAPARVLTKLERRLATAVAVRPPGDVDVSGLTGAAKDYGVQLEPVADGTWVTALRLGASATDTVARAARLALALRAFGDVAVATSFDEAEGARATSSVIDRVFRLLDKPGQERPVALVDELTAGLIDSAFVVERDPGASSGPGRLLGLRRDLDPRRLLLGRPTPFVGRDRELAVLSSTLAATVSEPAASAVFVLGPAGAGKSRLRLEAVKAAMREHPSLRILSVRAEPSRQSTALGVVGALVASEAQLLDDDAPAERRRRLLERLGECVAAEHLERVTQFLGELAGAPPPEPSLLLQGAKADPRRMWSETVRATEDWIAGELVHGPVLLVLEDVQWIDAQSLHVFSELLVRRDRPLLVLALGRPAVRSMIAETDWQTRPLQMLQLPPLGARASEALVRGVLGEGIAKARVDAIVARGEGHAFFIEELVRAEAEGRGDAAPATVVAMLQERIDRFEAEARRILRAASVFGLEFERDGVHALLEDGDAPTESVAAWLDTLVKREVVARAARPRFNKGQTYVFRHDLVHESIYATLTEDDRQRGHLLAARFLEQAGERDAAVLGVHFERGGDREHAASAFVRAAEAAYKRMDFEMARTLCARAEQNGAAGATLGSLRWVQACTALVNRTMEDTARFGLEAFELLPEGTTHWFHTATLMVTVAAFGKPELLGVLVSRVLAAGSPPDAQLGMAPIRTWALCANMLYFAGQYALAEEFVARIERGAAAAVANESVTVAWVHFARHVKASYCGGDPEHTLDEAERCALVLEEASDEILVWVRVEEAKAAALIGDFERAERLLRRAIDVAGRDNLWAAGLARHRLARVYVFTGRLEEARALELEAIQVFHEIGMPVMAAIGDNHLALIELAADRLDEAKTAIDRAHELLFAVPPLRTFALGTQALVALRRGDARAARAAIDEADAAIPTSGLINDGESLVELAAIETLLSEGDRAAAAARATKAAARLRERAARIERPAYRASFLERVPENTKILAHADALEGAA